MPKFAYEIDADDKKEFLECLAQGMKPNQAAKEVDTTGTRIKRLRNPEGAHYDPEFTKAWAEIEESGEHRRALEEQVRDMIWDSAAEGNVTMRWKLALTYLPEFEWAKHANLNVNHQIEIFTRAAPGLSMAALKEIQEALGGDGEEPKQLLEAHEVIEAA